MIIGKTKEQKQLAKYLEIIENMIPRKMFVVYAILDDDRIAFCQKVWWYTKAKLYNDEIYTYGRAFYEYRPYADVEHKENFKQIRNWIMNKYTPNISDIPADCELK